MNDITSCIRCGQCCINGGPTLHDEDIALIYNNILGPDALFTIRKGEPVYHPVAGRLIPAPDELIKIKGGVGSWACVFFDPAARVCNIYGDRPLECRIFKCWDTEDSIRLFMRDTLSRKTIVPEGSVLDKMISAYEDRFPVSVFMGLLDDISIQGRDVFGEISKIIDMDSSFRSKFIECLGAGEAEMDFLFGRPLKAIASAMGIPVI